MTHRDKIGCRKQRVQELHGYYLLTFHHLAKPHNSHK